MPVEYVALNQGTLVVEWWTGTISHDDVLAHVQRHLSDSSIQRGASVLVVASGASFETTPEQIHEVTDLYRRFVGNLCVGKAAILVNDSTYARGRLYEKQTVDLRLRVILFHSLDIACLWLGIADTTVCKELEKLRARSSRAS